MSKKLIYLVTEDWYFYSHRLPMVRAAQRAGFDVAVIANVDRHRAQIEEQGVEVIPLSLERRSLNPFKALGQIAALVKIYKREKPDIVHHIAMKPILYGSIAALVARVPYVINAFAGLGFLFTAQSIKARVLRLGLALPFWFLLKRKNSHTLFQNRDDRDCLRQRGLIVDERTTIIRGSGVDLEAYPVVSVPDPAPDVICAFAGRMIDIKGLPTLKEAFAIIETRAPHVKLWLCGQPDAANPGSWDEARLKAWESGSENVVYKGACDMPQIWAQAHMALQVSYGGEGVPKSLLEAASCGRALMATDVPGCREVVKDGVNGYLVPPHNALALADKIIALAGNYDLCRQMGVQSRKIVEKDFSVACVSAQTEVLYRRCSEGA